MTARYKNAGKLGGNMSKSEIMEFKGLKIYLTEDMDSLNKFFEENHLEVSDAEPVETNVIKAWKVLDKEEKLVGGVCLAYREGEYIIDGIAVEERLRGFRLGEKLLELATTEVRHRGGNKIFLVAKAPEFFKTQGYITVDDSEAPLFYECASCPQYKVDCFPEIMKWEDEK